MPCSSPHHIMHLMIQSGFGTSTMHVETKSDDIDTGMTVEKLLIKNDGAEKTTLVSAVNAADTTFSFSSSLSVAANDFMRIDDEYLQVQSVSGSDITVVRAQLGTVAASHTSGALIYALSPIIKENLYRFGGMTGSSYSGPQMCIDDTVTYLRSELNPSDPSTIVVEELPVIFKRRPDLGNELNFLAYTPNVVNDLIAQSKAIICDPDGPKVGGVDYFRNYINIRVSTYLTPVFIDAWSLHRIEGNVHCGSNTRRSELSANWWEAWKN
jgi:hypothetical protein